MGEPKKDPDGVVRWRMRIGGFDKRKLMFKGTLELEEFEYDDLKGTFCVMNRDQVGKKSYKTTRQAHTGA